VWRRGHDRGALIIVEVVKALPSSAGLAASPSLAVISLLSIAA
jgi:hypothetical protein